jgi:hydrogenase/urease accessory protein HupE
MNALASIFRVSALLLMTGVVFAHETRPVAIEITQQKEAHYQVVLRVPSSIAFDNHPTLQWPSDCHVQVSSVQCEQPIADRVVSVVWPLYNPSVTTLMRFVPLNSETRTAVLTPGINEWRIPATPTTGSIIKSYFELGVHHILSGIDHLLFVAGLLLIARGTRRVILAITGFTVAHSITLSLATLGLVHVPVAPTEAAIALSILFLAREALSQDKSTLAHRYPLIVSASFGLLHGLGFAAALAEVGLPKNEIVWSLLFFNLGVEAGQLLFILVVLGIVTILMRLNRSNANVWIANMNWRRASAYTIGIPAAYWLLARLQIASIL